MSSAAIDACCLIDLLATGHVEAILRAAGFDWHLPSAVQGEVQHVRQHDPAQPGQFLKVAVDLSPLDRLGRACRLCGPADQTEQDRFVHYAAQFRSDGEAMCIAIAEQRGWVVATDDRKAIRVAQQAGLTVVSCPELVKRGRMRRAGSGHAVQGLAGHSGARPVQAEPGHARVPVVGR